MRLRPSLTLRRWLAILVAGAAASLAMWLYLQQTQVLVPVAARPVAPLTPIAARDVGWRRLPKAGLLPTTRLEAPTGLVSSRTVLAGEAFDERTLLAAPPGRTFGSLELTPGRVAMAVPLGPLNGLGGALRSGDQVVIMASEEGAVEAVVLVSAARVLEVRGAGGGIAAGPEAGVAILELWPDEALRLSAGLASRRVSLGVVHGGPAPPAGQAQGLGGGAP